MLDADNLRMSYHQKSSSDWSDPGLSKYVTCLVANISFFFISENKKTEPKDFSKPARENMENYDRKWSELTSGWPLMPE